MQSYWFSKQSKINIIYNISVITITITMNIILENFGKYAISDCPFIYHVYLFSGTFPTGKIHPENQVKTCKISCQITMTIISSCTSLTLWSASFSSSRVLASSRNPIWLMMPSFPRHSSPRRGRTRQNTRMLPFKRKRKHCSLILSYIMMRREMQFAISITSP